MTSTASNNVSVLNTYLAPLVLLDTLALLQVPWYVTSAITQQLLSADNTSSDSSNSRMARSMSR